MLAFILTGITAPVAIVSGIWLEARPYCHHGNNSQHIGAQGCTSASEAGTAIGAALIIIFRSLT